MLPLVSRKKTRRRRLPRLQICLAALLAVSAMGLYLTGWFRLHPRLVAEEPSPVLDITGIVSESGILEGQAGGVEEELHLPPLVPETAMFCDRHFGNAWLQEWNSTARPACGAPQHGADSSRVQSRAIVDAHMPQASAPQVLLDATNLIVDPRKMHAFRCPVHRPRYMCGSSTYNGYDSGAFAVSCSWPQPLLEDYSRDHLRDIVSSFVRLEDDTDQQVEHVEEARVLLVTRESKEYSNVFHMLTDLFNTYLTLRMLGWNSQSAAPVRVVLLDNHPAGPLDGMWAGVAAAGGRAALQAPWDKAAGAGLPLLARASKLPGRTRFRHAAFVPPGYASLFFAHLYENASCPYPMDLFAGFRQWVMGRVELTKIDSAPDQGLCRVIYVSRQTSGGKRKHRVTRRVGNENEIMSMLASIYGAAPRMVDLAAMSLLDQLGLLSTTDLFIGMHGAALAWAVLLPPHAGVVELWPQPTGIWRCYEHLSHWAGLLYRRWEPELVASVSGGRPKQSLAVTNVDIPALREIITPLVQQIATRKEHSGSG